MNGMELLDTVAGGMFHHLWSVSWQVCVLAALAFLAERMYRNAPPSFRYWLWMLVLARLCVPFDIPLPSSISGYVTGNINPITASFKNIPGFDPSPTLPGIDPFTIVGIMWLAGTVSMLGLTGVRYIRSRRFLSEIEPVDQSEVCGLVNRLAAEMSIRKSVGLYITRNAMLHTPALTGVIRPKIILPLEFTSWPVEDLEPVLLHEMVHVRRNDLFFNWVQIIIQAVYFFHPIAWLANTRIRTSREEICDDVAISSLRMERKRYSLSMIRVGEAILKRNRFSFAEIHFSERKSSLGERIRRIMDATYNPHRRMPASSVIILCAVMVFGVALACGNSRNLAKNAENTGSQALNQFASETPDINITVESDGKYRIAGKPIKKNNLEQALRRQLSKSSTVIIGGATDAPIEAISFVMDTAAKAGVEGIAMTPDIGKRMVETGKAKMTK